MKADGVVIPSGEWWGDSDWARHLSMALGVWFLLRRGEPAGNAGYRSAVASRNHRGAGDDLSSSETGGRVTEDGSSSAGVPLGSAAFDEFYVRHEQPLYGYLRRLLPTHEIAIEIAQEAFFRAWRHFDSLQAYDRPEAWLYRVATNLAISHLRRKSPLSFSALLARVRPDDVAVDGLGGADLIPSPLDIEGQTAERDAIDRALRALPERPRAALLLAAIQGFNSDEIADALGVTPNNARQILSRARERFRRFYEQGRHA
ncbi:MAG TPA: sigma-70 family RNA polymerase sigma factor [Ktedonobacterales bacterium]|nr:sigma-70 family RNA polymerase sigma factor [Ktedonobacterales bacterium]